MREIKFRAWDNVRNRFEEDITLPLGRMSENIEEDRFTLCQYTGLKDKNGKEIYEGDIYHWLSIEFKTGKVVVDEKLEVFFDEECPGYYVNLNGMEERLFERRTKKNEIIGNVYENPELIKEENYHEQG